MDSACPLFKFWVIEVLFVSLTAKDKPIEFTARFFTHGVIIHVLAAA